MKDRESKLSNGLMGGVRNVFSKAKKARRQDPEIGQLVSEVKTVLAARLRTHHFLNPSANEGFWAGEDVINAAFP